MAAESEFPRSTSSRTSMTTLDSAALSVWSARMVSAFRMGRPELTIVANCRENTDRSFSLTWPGRSENSRLSPVDFFSLTASGV